MSDNGGGGGDAPPLSTSPTQQQIENNNENAKKVKLNNGAEGTLQQNNSSIGDERPSRVVHIRNIPSDVSETEIVHLGIPFGRVSNVLVLKVDYLGCHGNNIIYFNGMFVT
jgi:hypothetical protein